MSNAEEPTLRNALASHYAGEGLAGDELNKAIEWSMAQFTRPFESCPWPYASYLGNLWRLYRPAMRRNA